MKYYEVKTMYIFAALDKKKADIENTRDMNLAAVKPAPFISPNCLAA
jgi:hypothetical protein